MMQPEWIRASVALEREQDPEDFLRRLEEERGRPAEPIRRLRSVKVLVLLLTAPELERVSRMPGVRRAGPEGRCQLPPRPAPKQRRE